MAFVLGDAWHPVRGVVVMRYSVPTIEYSASASACQSCHTDIRANCGRVFDSRLRTPCAARQLLTGYRI